MVTYVPSRLIERSSLFIHHTPRNGIRSLSVMLDLFLRSASFLLSQAEMLAISVLVGGLRRSKGAVG